MEILIRNEGYLVKKLNCHEKNNRRTKLRTCENTGTQYWLIKIKFSLKTQDQKQFTLSSSKIALKSDKDKFCINYVIAVTPTVPSFSELDGPVYSTGATCQFSQTIL